LEIRPSDIPKVSARSWFAPSALVVVGILAVAGGLTAKIAPQAVTECWRRGYPKPIPCRNVGSDSWRPRDPAVAWSTLVPALKAASCARNPKEKPRPDRRPPATSAR
jgi:hypothetical protein